MGIPTSSPDPNCPNLVYNLNKNYVTSYRTNINNGPTSNLL